MSQLDMVRGYIHQIEEMLARGKDDVDAQAYTYLLSLRKQIASYQGSGMLTEQGEAEAAFAQDDITVMIMMLDEEHDDEC